MMSGSKSMRHTKKKEAYLMNLMFKIAYVVLYLWPLPTWEPFHMSIPSQATIVSLQDLENTHETNKIRSAMVKLDLFRDTFLELDPAADERILWPWWFWSQPRCCRFSFLQGQVSDIYLEIRKSDMAPLQESKNDLDIIWLWRQNAEH